MQGHLDKKTVVESLLPASIEKFPWGGHMGLRMLEQVIDAVEAAMAAGQLLYSNGRAMVAAARKPGPTWHRVGVVRRPA